MLGIKVCDALQQAGDRGELGGGARINDELLLDLRSTMTSPRTGILSLIRFDSGQN